MAYESTDRILFEWDGFCDTLKLAFEYDGIQHHEYPNPFYQTYKEFEGQRSVKYMEWLS